MRKTVFLVAIALFVLLPITPAQAKVEDCEVYGAAATRFGSGAEERLAGYPNVLSSINPTLVDQVYSAVNAHLSYFEAGVGVNQNVKTEIQKEIGEFILSNGEDGWNARKKVIREALTTCFFSATTNAAAANYLTSENIARYLRDEILEELLPYEAMGAHPSIVLVPLSERLVDVIRNSIEDESYACNFDDPNSTEEQCSQLAGITPGAVDEDKVTGPVSLGLARRVSNFYNWALGAGSMIALAIIIYGGVLYSASGGNPGRIEEAKKWMQHAVFGLILLLASYVILNTINPDLTNLEEIFLDPNPTTEGQVLERMQQGARTRADQQITCFEECVAIGEGPPGACYYYPSCKDAAPVDCNGEYCNVASFAEYAKSFTTAIEVSGDSRPTTGAHLKYISTEPLVHKSSGSDDCFGADCGVYVATVVRNTIDSSFPSRGTESMWDYLIGSNKYEVVHMRTTNDLRTGDIMMPSDYTEGGTKDRLPHGHVSLWIDGGTYEAAWGGDTCSTGYLPRGPRRGISGKSDPWPVMDTIFRYKGFSSGGPSTPSNSGPGLTPPTTVPSERILPLSADASFSSLSRNLGGTHGLAITYIGSSQVEVVGSLSSAVAWSTIKVPMAFAALAQDSDANAANINDALTESDNAAAARLWEFLGGGTTAANKVQYVLGAAGDFTKVQSEKIRLDNLNLSAYGQTNWSLSNQAKFMATLNRSQIGRDVLSVMRNVVSRYRWGLFTIDSGAAAKSGWGPGSVPGETGSFFIRQMGQANIGGTNYSVAIAAIPASGGFEAGQRHLNEIAKWLETTLENQSSGGPSLD